MTDNQSRDSQIGPDELTRIVDDASNKALSNHGLKDEGSSTGWSLLDDDEPAEPPDADLAPLLSHPCVVLILGHRGSGKTALACRLQELSPDVAPLYGVGLPPRASRLLPEWCGLTGDFTGVPSNAIIYVAESYRLFHAR